MPPLYSPSIRRRRLSAELRRLRDESGMSLVEAAKKAGLGKSNLSKIEAAESKTVPRPTLNKLLDAYEVTDQARREGMHELSRLAGERGWWTKYKDLIPAALTDFEAEASAVRTYEAQVVPGLLQTAEYAEAVFRANKVRADDEIAQRVAARLKRQEVLNKVDPPDYCAVLDEAVLRRVVGSVEVMKSQLRHLAHMAARHNIDLYVLPFSAGAHPATEGSFVIMDFPDPQDSSIAYVETPTSSLYLEEERELREINNMFGGVQGSALSPAQTLSFIKDISDQLEA